MKLNTIGFIKNKTIPYLTFPSKSQFVSNAKSATGSGEFRFHRPEAVFGVFVKLNFPRQMDIGPPIGRVEAPVACTGLFWPVPMGHESFRIQFGAAFDAFDAFGRGIRESFGKKFSFRLTETTMFQ